MFLHYIVNQSESSLLYKFFICQVKKPCKEDWVLSVQDDLKLLKLENYFFEQLKSISKNQFKKLLNEKIRVKAFEHLINIKNTQTKIKNIQYNTLKLQSYLNSSEVNSDSASYIFLCRSKMLDIKANYKGKYRKNNLYCESCLKKDIEETQEHIYTCESLSTGE